MLSIVFRHVDIGRVRLFVRNNRVNERIPLPDKVRFGHSSEWEIEREESDKGGGAEPIFFEWQQLEVFFEAEKNNPYQVPFQLFLNQQPTVFKSFQGQEDNLLFGSLSLANAVGYTDLEIRDGSGKTVFLLETEVFPQKLTYKSDFEEMVNELSDEVYNLAYGLLKKTFVQTQPIDTENPSTLEWLSIFETLFQSLQRRLLTIWNQPHSEVVSRGVAKSVEKVRHLHPKSFHWLRKRPYLLRPAQKDDIIRIQGYAPTQLLELQKQVSYDTAENRFLYWMLKQLELALRDTANFIQKHALSKRKKELILEKMSLWIRQLASDLQQPIFNEVSEFHHRQGLSTVLNRAPGYRELYQIYLMLKKGLTISDEAIFRMDYKEITTLYEYWCYLRVIKYFREHDDYELASQDLVKLSGDRLSIKLKKGETSKVVFEGKHGENRVIIWYNRVFGAGETGTFRQVPDILIEIYKGEYRTPFRFILDAKYQLDPPDQPPKDAIAQLHRYRDSILSEKKRGRIYTSALKSLGGAILFPYPGNEGEFESHKLYRSLLNVQIGAIPMHPGKNREHSLFEKSLNRLLESSPEALNEKMIEYEKRDHQKMITETDRKTFIARIPDDLWYLQKKQFVWEKRLYYMSVMKDEVEIDQLALYDSRTKGIVAWAEVEQVHRLSAEQLKNLGVSWPLRNTARLYSVFVCAAWKPCFLALPHLPEKPLYISKWGLKQAIRLNEEACLWLTDYEWIRAWQEIRRIDTHAVVNRDYYPEIEIQFVWKQENWVCRKGVAGLYLEKDEKKIPFTPDFDVFFS